MYVFEEREHESGRGWGGQWEEQRDKQTPYLAESQTRGLNPGP